MRILITGICGFVGSSLAHQLLGCIEGLSLYGLDNFIRPGSERNRRCLTAAGAKLFHADIRNASDLETLPAVDWVIDAAANPSVLAGIDGRSSSRQVVEHNLGGTINLLEFCRKHGAGFLLLSTSRVYSIPGLSDLRMILDQGAYTPDPDQVFPPGISTDGVSEVYSTTPPVSLYGSTKVASESLALEYGATFGFPVRVNRCGVLAGAGQFGRPDQGIFSFWIHSWKQRRPLKYIGFDGKGHQARDCLHPEDLAMMVRMQLEAGSDSTRPSLQNLSGGSVNTMSLRQLSAWCAERFGQQPVDTEPAHRPFDIPWMVLDSRRAHAAWGWKPERDLESILAEIARHAEENPDWLEVSAPYG